MQNILLGKRIREARKAMGLTQERLGIKVGVSRPAIVQWESDAKRPNYERLCMLAAALRITPNQLLLGHEEAQDPTPVPPSQNAGDNLPFRQAVEISWTEAATWNDSSNHSLDLTDRNYWGCPIPCGPDTFAVRLTNPTDWPQIPKGSLLFVDPSVPVVHNAQVLTQIPGEPAAVLRRSKEAGIRRYHPQKFSPNSRIALRKSSPIMRGSACLTPILASLARCSSRHQ